MNVYHTFFCFLFIALQDGNSGLVNADGEVYTVMEGQDFTVQCLFTLSGRTKFFCREPCSGGNILIETTKNKAKRGRYNITYEEGFFPSRNTILYVSIKQLKKSDSGWYRCALGRLLLPESYHDFKIVVKEASTTSGPKLTLGPFPPSTRPTEQSFSSSSGRSKPPSASTATRPTEQSLSSSSGRSKPPSASIESTEQLHSSPSRSDLHLSVGLVLVAMTFILSIALMIFWRKRRSTKPEVPPVETNYADVTESNRVYEEIREEDGRRSSPPVETSSIYSYAKNTEPNGAENTDDYSFVSRPLREAEDDSSKLVYTEVDFSNVAASSLNSAPCGDVDNVLYSSLQMDVTSTNNTGDVSPPLYATVHR